MVIHSIIPYEKIFEDYPELTETQEYKKIKGGYVEVINTSGKNYISRVISTDPRLYLDKTYMPGSLYKDAAD